MVFISVNISNETTSHCTYYYSNCLRCSRYQTIIFNRAVQRDYSYELTLAMYYYWVQHISFSYYLLTIYLVHVHWPVLATWSSPISFSLLCNMFETFVIHSKSSIKWWYSPYFAGLLLIQWTHSTLVCTKNNRNSWSSELVTISLLIEAGSHHSTVVATLN